MAARQREKAIEARVSEMQRTMDDAATLAAHVVREGEAEAARLVREAEDTGVTILQQAWSAGAALQEDLLAEVEAEAEAVVRRAEADAARLRANAERLFSEATRANEEADRIRSEGRRYAAQLTTTALEATLEPRDSSPAVDTAPHARRLISVLRFVLPVVLVFGAAFCVRAYALEPFRVDGHSMVPSLSAGDRVMVNKFAYHLHAPQRGDIVVLASGPGMPKGHLVKRIAGLPGETIAGTDAGIRVDGRLLDRPNETPGFRFGPLTIPSGEVFVLGDNRAVSFDSRDFGPVPLQLVVGRVDLVIWPPSDIGPLS